MDCHIEQPAVFPLVVWVWLLMLVSSHSSLPLEGFPRNRAAAVTRLYGLQADPPPQRLLIREAAHDAPNRVVVEKWRQRLMVGHVSRYLMFDGDHGAPRTTVP